MHNSVKTSLPEKNEVNETSAGNPSRLSVAITKEGLKGALAPGFWDLLDDCAMFWKIADLQLFKECSAFLESLKPTKATLIMSLDFALTQGHIAVENKERL